jgi:hypothetical protein
MSRAPRDTSRKYHRLYLARQDRFRSFFSGKADVPSVERGYIRRHPNTVVLPAMDGVKYSRNGFIKPEPLLGKSVDNFEAKLRMWINKGLIAATLLSKVSRSEERAFNHGIISDFKFDFLPVAEGGASTFCLANNVLGLQELWFQHKLYVEAIDDDDYQLPITQHWDILPVPLLWLYRVDTAVSKNTNLPPINVDTALFYFKAIVGVDLETFTEWDQPHAEDNQFIEHHLEAESEFESMLKRLLDSVDLTAFQAKIIPRSRMTDEEGSLYAAVREIEGTQYVESGEGNWVPVSSSDKPTDFWDQPDSGSEIAEFPWD